MYLPLASAILIMTICSPKLEALNDLKAVSMPVGYLKLSSLGVQYDRGELRILDQQKLPGEEEWIDVQTPEQMVEIITSLKVRGAPLIGIAAILSLAQLAERGESPQKIEEAAYLLRKSRPTAVNLVIYIDRVLLALKENSNIVPLIKAIFLEDISLCEAMGKAGAGVDPAGRKYPHHLQYWRPSDCGHRNRFWSDQNSPSSRQKNPCLCV